MDRQIFSVQVVKKSLRVQEAMRRTATIPFFFEMISQSGHPNVALVG